jgi:hypothetical protein
LSWAWTMLKVTRYTSRYDSLSWSLYLLPRELPLRRTVKSDVPSG